MDRKKNNEIFLSKCLPRKVLVIMIIGFVLKLFFSCTPPPPIEMQYNSINITGIDNSGRFMGSYASVDTMYSGAVALKLTLFDSTHYYYAFTISKVLKSLSFTPAMAFSVDESYIPVNKVEQIIITTLFDIDEDVKAGDDISNLIVYDTGGDFELYQNMNNAIGALNRTQSEASGSIAMVLLKPIENTKAQFNVRVTLDTGNELSFSTGIFTIITQ
ncbi:MAG: hypothetical protein WCX31_05610 [Salinivirgaceae bacterium]